MEFKTKIQLDIDEKEWDSDLQKNHYSTCYHTSNFAKVFQDSYNSVPIFLSTYNSKGLRVGQNLIFIHNQYFWNQSSKIKKNISGKLKLGPFLDWHYGPIIHDIDNVESILSSTLSAIENIIPQYNVVNVKGSTSPFTSPFSKKILTNHDYKIKEWKTYLIDLNQNPKDYFEKLDKKIRYDINKTEKTGLTFEIVSNKEGLKEYSNLSKKQFSVTMGIHGKTNQIRMESDWKHLFQNDMLKIFLARYDGKIISGIHTYVYNGNVIQNGVTNDPLSKIHAGSYLTYNTIKWCMDNNYSSYDMGGANPNPDSDKEARIDFYKSKWNCNEKSYLKFSKIHEKFKWLLSTVLKNPKTLYTR